MSHTILQNKKETILTIHRELLQSKNLKPSKQTNGKFLNLVDTVINTSFVHASHILKDVDIKDIQDSLRNMSSQAESELELFWTKKILNSKNPEKALVSFPYYTNYKTMTEFEMKELQTCRIHKNHKVLFVGSGPLPLSSIMMAAKFDITIDNIDVDKEACTLSRKLLQILKLSDRIKTIQNNILGIHDFSAYDVIFVAALVGQNENEKGKIINHIVSNSKKDSHIIMRSVHNLGSLLYPKITNQNLKNIHIIKKKRGPKSIINNIIIGKKK